MALCTETWIPGVNAPAFGRGKFHVLNEAGHQVVANLLTNMDRLPAELLNTVNCALLGRRSHSQVQHDSVIAVMCGVSRGTVRNWRDKLRKHGSGFSALGKTREVFVQGSYQSEEGPGECHVEPLIVDPPLPEGELPELPYDEMSESESADGDLQGWAEEPFSGNTLQQWQSHPNFALGMRMAELATMWYVHGWAQKHWPEFMAWAKHSFPDNSVGNINHSGRFVKEFLPALVGVTHSCVSSSLHEVLPALGVPSLVSRVIDVVSINGQSLLPTVYIYTNGSGEVSWALLGSPCLENLNECKDSAGQAAANGATETFFGFHKSPQMVRTVHQLEATYGFHRDDRALRVVSTIADQAIQGPGSIRFSEQERLIDNLPPDPLSEGICRFHIADGVGGAVDRAFGETITYDRMLRLIRRHFAWGTGKLIFRSVATKFENIAREFDKTAEQYNVKAASGDAKNQPMAAQRMRVNASKASAEASALRRAGWTTWRQPMAPKADGTRKVVWQTRSRVQFVYVYGLVYWGIQARMQQTLENIRQRHIKDGKTVTAETGLRTKEMRAWRSLGKSTLDIRLLVFNLGRADFRKKHLHAYAMAVQSSLRVVSIEQAIECSHSMMAAVGALIEVRGIMRLLQRLLFGLSLVASEDGHVIISNKEQLGNRTSVVPRSHTLWMTSKTLLAHRCWRRLPVLSQKLTEPDVPIRAAKCCGVPPECRAARVCCPLRRQVPPKCRPSAAPPKCSSKCCPLRRCAAEHRPSAACKLGSCCILFVLLPRR